MSELTEALFTQDPLDATLSHKALDGTAELNTLAIEIANTALTTMLNDLTAYGEDMKASQTDNEVLDTLVDTFITDEHRAKALDICKDKSHELCIQILKSQQSCRSRTRHKAMTKGNYKRLLVTAICERLLRGAANMPNGSLNGKSAAASLEPYTKEELVELAKDQDNVRRILRNVQSKKTGCKKLPNYESSDRWHKLEVLTAQLISIRQPMPKNHGKPRLAKLEELMEGVDLSQINLDDCKELLSQMKQTIDAPIDTGINQLPEVNKPKDLQLVNVPISEAAENPATAETTRRAFGESVKKTRKTRKGKLVAEAKAEANKEANKEADKVEVAQTVA